MYRFLNLRYLPAGISILQFVYRIELSFIMFTIQNPAALRILVDLSCFVLGNLFPLDLLKEKVLVFRETPTHCSVAYIHDPLL
jgi:hypothetical protein